MVDLVSEGDEVVVTDPALPFTLNVVIKYEQRRYIVYTSLIKEDTLQARILGGVDHLGPDLIVAPDFRTSCLSTLRVYDQYRRCHG